MSMFLKNIDLSSSYSVHFNSHCCAVNVFNYPLKQTQLYISKILLECHCFDILIFYVLIHDLHYINKIHIIDYNLELH